MKYPKFEIKVDEPNRVVFGYAYGKLIKAIAICDKNDEFDANFGTKLVAAKLRKACTKLKLQELNRARRVFLKHIDADIANTETILHKQENCIHNIKITKYPEEQ